MKTRKQRVILYALIAIAVLLTIAVTSVLSTGETKEEALRREVLAEHGYELPRNMVRLQLLEFDKFVEVLSAEQINDEEYAQSVAKLFIIDFFTWTNKEGRYDVGGVDYLALGFGANFRLSAVNSFYYNMNEYVEEYGKVNLLEVSEIEVFSITETEYQKTDGTNYEKAYVIRVSWSYAENEVFDTERFQKTSHLTVVKDDDGKYRIAYFLRD